MDSNLIEYDQDGKERVQGAVQYSNPFGYLTPEEKKQADFDRRKGRPTYQEHYQKEYDEQARKAFEGAGRKGTYSPAISAENSRNVRRIAWAARQPMTKTMNEIVIYVGRQLDREKICKACTDRSFCPDCMFGKK